MRCLTAILLLAAALNAGAAEDKRAEFARLLEEGSFPGINYFLESAGGRWGAPAAAFAQASSDDPAVRITEWTAFNALLYGGNLDKRGDNVRRELAKLPGEQWHFVIKLEKERRALYDRLGWGPGGNIVQNSAELVGAKVEPRLCSDRSSKLAAVMAPVEKEGRFSGWRTEEITANMVSVRDSRGLRDELYGGVHWAPCFVYDDGRTRVELVADAWRNALVPGYTWWYNFDKATHDYLYKAGGRDWCGEAILEKAVQAQIKARHPQPKPSPPPKSGTLDGIQGSSPF